MEITYSLLQKLSLSEKALLMHNLSFVPPNNQGKDNKMLKLAEFLMNSEELPKHTECLEGVYGRGASGKKIINLKKRLLNKILDVFITESEFERNPKLEEISIEWIKAKKKLTQFYTLYFSGKGAKISLPLLNEAIFISKKHEYYIVLLECLRFKKLMVGFRKGVTEFNTLQKEIDFYEECSKVVNTAADAYYYNIIPEDFSAINEQNRRIQRLKSTIKNLKKANGKVKSAVGSYYIKMLELNLYMSLDDYPKVRLVCKDLLTLISSSKAVFRRTRISSTYGNLSRCELLSLNYDLAVKYALKAQEFYLSGSVNYSISKEQEFYALFYGGKLNEAFVAAKELLNTSPAELGEFRHSKYAFFIACVHFKNNDPKKALSILDHNQALSKDKEGWDIAIKLLRIMCNIEMDEYIQTSLLIEAFKKQILKYSSKKPRGARHKLINALLYQLEKQGFNFKLLNEKGIAILKQLKETRKDHSWEFLGPELIPIHEWFENKMKSKRRSLKTSR